jgi:hypothetical protein
MHNYTSMQRKGRLSFCYKILFKTATLLMPLRCVTQILPTIFLLKLRLEITNDLPQLPELAVICPSKMQVAMVMFVRRTCLFRQFCWLPSGRSIIR